MIKQIISVALFALSGVLHPYVHSQQLRDSTKSQAGDDFPVGILHGTWDFDEWPGIDHEVVYKKHYLYKSSDGEKIKIDFSQTDFDSDDHEGYLKTPYQLQDHGKKNLINLLESNSSKTILGIFTHPDDDVLLSGGLLAYAALNGWDVRVVLVSNGADGSRGYSDKPAESIGGYNAFGILDDGTAITVTDSMALYKEKLIPQYSDILGVRSIILPVQLQIDGKVVTQLGEYAGLDWVKTFGPNSRGREEMKRSLNAFIDSVRPSIVITHGTNGEYGNYLHKTVHAVVLELLIQRVEHYTLLTAFPEYNSSDTITHYLDLDLEAKKYRNLKYEAFKALTFIHTPGIDYDKPWDPTDALPDGVFVKDYGYSPIEGFPPRYEFYHLHPLVVE